ncbi:hypothetical protein DYQ86_09345 [Acidobacteria bacterium AB60]|nr:hypothetical protein DYQ86_09345 [Acidobacteria bacterium AB60]
MTSTDPTLDLVRAHTADAVLGSIFFFVGATACFVAAFRHRRASRTLLWFGVFIGLYGARMLAILAETLHLYPHSAWPMHVEVLGNYVLVVPSLLFWAERTRAWIQKLFLLLSAVGLAIAVAGLITYIVWGKPYAFIGYSFLLAVGTMLLVGPLPAFPGLFHKYFQVQSLVLRIVMPAIALLVLVINVLLFFGHPPSRYIEPVAFAVWVFAIGCEAAKNTFDNERRLVSIEGELETARQIQSSLLPATIPHVHGLRIAASYQPMSAVAGDYYQFVPVDHHHLGVLVADVTGHGVPAALIASMIKVAMQSAVAVASQPDLVMRQLNQILTPELSGRLTSAAYLWLDTELHTARYSAAGHPALLHWKAARHQVEHIESNGLLLGIASDRDYPDRQLAFNPGDRFLLYTDGLIEPENAQGKTFGEDALDTVLKLRRSLAAAELSSALLTALRNWQPPKAVQLDDITLIAIDVVEEPLRLTPTGRHLKAQEVS